MTSSSGCLPFERVQTSAFPWKLWCNGHAGLFSAQPQLARGEVNGVLFFGGITLSTPMLQMKARPDRHLSKLRMKPRRLDWRFDIFSVWWDVSLCTVCHHGWMWLGNQCCSFSGSDGVLKCGEEECMICGCPHFCLLHVSQHASFSWIKKAAFWVN